MKPNENLIGRPVTLPDGQKVVIEKVEDGLATARRIDGEFEGMIVVCAIEKLITATAS